MQMAKETYLTLKNTSTRILGHAPPPPASSRAKDSAMRMEVDFVLVVRIPLQVVSSVEAGASCAVAPGATTNAGPAARIMVAAPRDTRLIFSVVRVAYPYPAGFFLSDQ